MKPSDLGVSQVLEANSAIAGGVTESEINSMVSDAIRSPSGDNSQPWRFHWDGMRLLILHSEPLARHSLNRKNHASIIGLGAVIEALRISASKHQLSIITSLLFKSRGELSPWAEIRFVKFDQSVDPLASTIPTRATDRRAYQGGSIDNLRGQLELISKEFPGCKIHIRERQSPEFLSYFLKTDEFLWKNSKIVRDLGKWLRLTNREISSSSDGMSYKNIGLSKSEALAFRLIRKFPKLPRFLWSLGFGLRIRQESKKAIESSAALLCFSVETIDSQSLCRVGQMAFRTWLLLNANGFGVQPLSYSSTSIADLVSGALAQDTPIAERELFEQGRLIFSRNFSMNQKDQPVWLFRTGVSPGLPMDYRAVKKTAKQVRVEFLDWFKPLINSESVHTTTVRSVVRGGG